MLSDIEISQSAALLPINKIAAQLDISEDALEPYGRYKAKIDPAALNVIDRQGKLILVTAISPTPPGEGKTTTTIGLGDALRRLGKRVAICLREPSMGPVFGRKGGATGGGHAQIVPMEDINLHFTGDFAAIGQAHNLLAALIDNHIQGGNSLAIDPRRVTWRRVLDMNDRALRHIVIGLGGPADGVPRESGFDIVVASEIMAILCLADDFADLKQRIGRIVIGRDRQNRPVTAADLKGVGAMAALLRHAIKPNLVQTLDGTPALIHGGPFANIAHGCNSVIATRLGLSLADYVVTEAGFGADLGAEKFINIKCRKSGLAPIGAVVVATLRALKYHGGAALPEVGKPNRAALDAGLANLFRHIDNVQDAHGLPCVVAINHFVSDTDDEIAHLIARVAEKGVRAVPTRHWAEGGAGALDLARAVLHLTDRTAPAAAKLLYADKLPLKDKIAEIAKRIYGAAAVTFESKAAQALDRIQADGYGHFPVCMAKTQTSFSTDPKALGAPSGHVVNIREVRLAAGAEFVVAICGDIVTMPGLPAQPAAEAIDVLPDGRITGLS